MHGVTGKVGVASAAEGGWRQETAVREVGARGPTRLGGRRRTFGTYLSTSFLSGMTSRKYPDISKIYPKYMPGMCIHIHDFSWGKGNRNKVGIGETTTSSDNRTDLRAEKRTRPEWMQGRMILYLKEPTSGCKECENGVKLPATNIATKLSQNLNLVSGSGLNGLRAGFNSRLLLPVLTPWSIQHWIFPDPQAFTFQLSPMGPVGLSPNLILLDYS
ncbi:hypothetical protein B0H17DRAFT_1244030 [Mycena rosella]|uniref:Uncharacterized protein n=1 Tax=Mycena rosella TaxID=1033263 RepID=A0AAD7D0A3_MYCRO|nr:hypothetical protein B0H17DRAFT_1244030 [Mycena rosella]